MARGLAYATCCVIRKERRKALYCASFGPLESQDGGEGTKLGGGHGRCNEEGGEVQDVGGEDDPMQKGKFVLFIQETFGGFNLESSFYCNTIAIFAENKKTTDSSMRMGHELRAGMATAIHRGNGAGARVCHMLRHS